MKSILEFVVLFVLLTILHSDARPSHSSRDSVLHKLANLSRNFNKVTESREEPPAIRVGAFNVQIFGASKLAKPDVVKSLLETLPRYDILLFQEIRDSSETAFPALIAKLNSAAKLPYSYVISGRLGRSHSKEQYAYIYRSDLFKVEATYQYPEALDQYERPPFGVVFTSTYSDLSRFGFLGVHTKPDEAEKEIDSLVDVYDAFSKEMNIQDVVLMGDFNGDCGYTTKTEMKLIRLRLDVKFHWLLNDDVDTTVAKSSCAYDRIVVVGEQMNAAIVEDSASVYRFDTVEHLDPEQTKQVSDHFPVEFLLYGKDDDGDDDFIDDSDDFYTGDEEDEEDDYEYK